MQPIADSARPRVEGDEADGRLEERLLRFMIASTAIAFCIAAFMAPWRTSSGLILGGALSVLNYRWLHASVAAIFNINLGTQQPRAGVSRYILRYLVIAAAVLAATNLRLVSLAATLVGLCSFVPALFVEAGRQFYFAIIHREESL